VFYFSLFKFLQRRADILQAINDSMEERENGSPVAPGSEDNENKEKCEKLYAEIIEYFEKYKPYTSSDFKISFLADELNSNMTYISNAINECSGLNFCSLVNKYRIEYVKQLIQEGYLDRYSMTYIYTKAGFKYQSTFNEIFKRIEKVTPREYVKKL
jgi:AraC-like DNA-binding protein